jgi:hypothetical protein
MCVYSRERTQEACEHHECSILATIRKLNRPIFKPKKKIEQERHKEMAFNGARIA